MKLDRYTQKAQEAILAAQQLASGAKSPVLDVEHLLAALLDDPEGIVADRDRDEVKLRRQADDLTEAWYDRFAGIQQ